MKVSVEEVAMLLGQKEIQIFALQKQIQELQAQLKKQEPPA